MKARIIAPRSSLDFTRTYELGGVMLAPEELYLMGGSLILGRDGQPTTARSLVTLFRFLARVGMPE